MNQDEQQVSANQAGEESESGTRSIHEEVLEVSERYLDLHIVEDRSRKFRWG